MSHLISETLNVNENIGHCSIITLQLISKVIYFSVSYFLVKIILIQYFFSDPLISQLWRIKNLQNIFLIMRDMENKFCKVKIHTSERWFCSDYMVSRIK